jgi:hypothetical protein
MNQESLAFSHGSVKRTDTQLIRYFVAESVGSIQLISRRE